MWTYILAYTLSLVCQYLINAIVTAPCTGPSPWSEWSPCQSDCLTVRTRTCNSQECGENACSAWSLRDTDYCCTSTTNTPTTYTPTTYTPTTYTPTTYTPTTGWYSFQTAKFQNCTMLRYKWHWIWDLDAMLQTLMKIFLIYTVVNNLAISIYVLLFFPLQI